MCAVSSGQLLRDIVDDGKAQPRIARGVELLRLYRRGVFVHPAWVCAPDTTQCYFPGEAWGGSGVLLS